MPGSPRPSSSLWPDIGDLYENTVTGEPAVVLRGDEAPELPMLAQLTVRPGGFVAGGHIHRR